MIPLDRIRIPAWANTSVTWWRRSGRLRTVRPANFMMSPPAATASRSFPAIPPKVMTTSGVFVRPVGVVIPLPSLEDLHVGVQPEQRGRVDVVEDPDRREGDDHGLV